MIGEFLEISLASADPLESLAFWQRAGFVQAPVGGAWAHPYAVLTDGRIHLGIHRRELTGPALCFVCPKLVDRLPAFEALGIGFEFMRFGSDRFNEAGFLDPDGQLVCLVEARTFSRAPDAPERSAFGWFGEYRMPVRSAQETARYWERLGFLAAPHAHARDAQLLAATGINLGAHEDRRLRAPTLAFYDEGMGARVERLQEQGIEIKRVTRDRSGAFESAELVSPEGLAILLLEGQL